MDHNTVRKLFDYDAITGILSWKISPRGNIKIGSPAGRKVSGGYLQVTIQSKCYQVHRIIWLWMTGSFPVEEIDHRNGIKYCNAWANLREATRAQNIMHQRRRRNNISGFKGVTYEKKKKLWRARIEFEGRRFSLGRFKKIKDAQCAYAVAAVSLNPEFACLD